MKAAFFTLLLLNLVFFGWAQWIDSPAAPTAAAPAQTALPTLALVEGDAEGGRAPAVPTTAAVSSPNPSASSGPAAAPAGAVAGAAGINVASAGVAATGARCRSLGPFMASTVAQQMAGRLRARGLSPVDRMVDISINDGYTVYLSEATADAAAQRRVVAKLTQAGIQDVHTVDGPRQEPRISLGLFADQARAVRRAEQVRQLGFKPVLDIHQSTVTTHWLDLQLEPNEPTPPVNQLLQEMPGGAASVSPVIAFSDCPTTTAGG